MVLLLLKTAKLPGFTHLDITELEEVDLSTMGASVPAFRPALPNVNHQLPSVLLVSSDAHQS